MCHDWPQRTTHKRQERLVNSSVSYALVVRGVAAFKVNTSIPRHPTHQLSQQKSNGIIYKLVAPMAPSAAFDRSRADPHKRIKIKRTPMSRV